MIASFLESTLFGAEYKKGLCELADNSLKAIIEKFEYNIISKTFEDTHFNITKTAEALKIPRSTLEYKLGKYNIK